MSDSKDIPVCTLFKVDADSGGNEDIFTGSPQVPKASDSKDSKQVNKEADVLKPDSPLEQKQIANEPGVCDIFQTVPSSEDLFSNLVIPQQGVTKNERNDSVHKDTTPVSENVESEGFEATVENPGKKLNHEFFQDQNKTSNVVGDAAITKDKIELKLDEVMGSKSENLSSPFNNSDLMSSIMINDSLDNLSNLSFDQDGKTNVASTDVKETNEKAQPVDQTKAKESLSKTVAPAFTPKIFVKDGESDKETTVAKDHDTTVVEEVPESAKILSSLAPNQPPVASDLFSADDQNSAFDEINQKTRKVDDDAFTNALQTSEIDRRQDAWIADEHTQTILNAVAQSQKRMQLESKHLARPGLATSESLGNPVKAVLARYKGISNTSQRNSLTADSVSEDHQGLQHLIKTKSYRAAVDLCGKALTKLGQGFGYATQKSTHSPDTLKWWHARFSLLVRLELCDLAATEFEHFQSFNSADLYYGFYPDLFPGRKGSMVPFSLRLLFADFPRHINKPNEALSRLYAMHAICTKIIKNLQSNRAEDGCLVELKPDDKEASLQLWNGRKVKVMFCIANTLLQLREYHSAIDVLDEIMSLSPSSSVPILSSVGRILLQLGDIKSAQQRFAQVERVAGASATYKVQLSMNRAFLYLGTNNWKEALNQFSQVLQLDPTNIEALNNKAVCLLYLCRLRDAIVAQEEAVRLKKETAEIYEFSLAHEVTMEGALSNLVTLYELESSKSMSKKQALLQHIAASSGDGFNVACLKL